MEELWRDFENAFHETLDTLSFKMRNLEPLVLGDSQIQNQAGRFPTR